MNKANTKNRHLKWILPLLILLIAVLGARATVQSRKAPVKKPLVNLGLLVETIQVVRQSTNAVVAATGTVEPLQEISLVAEVNGKLTWVAPGFADGGFFRKGEKLLEIDPRDYRLAIQKAEAELARARTALQTEEELSGIALREWQQLELPGKGTAGALVLRQPQLDSANATLAAAEATLELARLNLDRTHIIAPFNGRLRNKNVDLGEYVRTGSPLASLAGTDQAEIIVPLPLADLNWLEIPSAGSDKRGSNCIVSTQIGAQLYRWQGRISRSFGEIDRASRMAKIAIRVEDPYRFNEQEAAHAMPLANGLFVDIEIEGARLDQVVSIPRSALRDGDVVWLADENDQLEIRPVRVLRRQKQQLLLDQGLQGGERLILTNISGSASGLKLRPQAKERQQ